MIGDVDLAAVIGLEDYLDATPDRTRRAVSLAMNGVIGGSGLAEYRKAMGKEVNFPPGYLEDDKRFGQDQRASPDNLVASLVARQRPTTLARFSTSGTVGSRNGVNVRVSEKGGGGHFKSGFLVRLRAGSSLDGGNIGLAVRLKPGQTLNKKEQSRMVHLEANVVLLYGPSIDQVLNNGVAEKTTPEVIDLVATEFYRQYQRLE